MFYNNHIAPTRNQKGEDSLAFISQNELMTNLLQRENNSFNHKNFNYGRENIFYGRENFNYGRENIFYGRNAFLTITAGSPIRKIKSKYKLKKQ